MTTFTTGQLEQYRTDGFTTIPDFFSAREITAMRAELQRFKDEGLLRNVARAGDGVTPTAAANLQICPIAPHSALFRALGFHDRVRAAAQTLIGDPVTWQLDQIFLKPGGHGAGTSWHQDNAYFRISDPTRGVGMWTAVHDATIANGTMHVVPRQFNRLLEHERDGGSNHHIKCVVNEAEAIPIEMPAGGALFFNYAVPHCTRGNTTDRERAGLALHFVRTDFLTKKEGVNAILTGEGATHGVAEFGADQRGEWQRQVELLTA